MRAVGRRISRRISGQGAEFASTACRRPASLSLNLLQDLPSPPRAKAAVK